MELQGILILVLAAVFHSSWNLLAKKSLDKQVFLWLSLVAWTILFFPLFCFRYVPFPAEGWVCIALSGVLEAVYYILLGRAYQSGDLSLVYPVARGSVPLYVAFFAFVFLGEAASPAGLAGILAIVGGIYVLHLKSFDRDELLAPFRSLRVGTSRLALLTGLTTAGYSVVDKAGVSLVNPFIYMYLVLAAATFLIAPWMARHKKDLIKREWQENKRSIAVVTLLNATAYLLVLTVMTSNKISYVSPVREISVVFAALLGTIVLREPFGRQKIAGSLIIFSGIILIALAK